MISSTGVKKITVERVMGQIDGFQEDTLEDKIFFLFWGGGGAFSLSLL